MKEMHATQVQRETETLEKVVRKVERIKANQRKFEPNLIAAKTHHEGNFRCWNFEGCIFNFALFIQSNPAVRYNGKYLYEEFVEKAEFDPRQNESTIGFDESYLLRNHNRFGSVSKGLRNVANISFVNESCTEEPHTHATEPEVQSQCSNHKILLFLNLNNFNLVLSTVRKLFCVDFCQFPDFNYTLFVQILT